MIHLLFTGGTISMERDSALGGNVPAHDGERLVQLAPDLQRYAPLHVEDWARVPACHLGPERLWALRERVREIQEGSGTPYGARPDGIVVTHGTDVLEETAYLLARTLEPRLPVALTGAMRTSSEPGWDGPRNLVDAAAVAAEPRSTGRGALVVFAGKVFAGQEAVKVHTVDTDAFAAPHGAAIGRVGQGRVQYDAPPRPPALAPAFGLSARVALISAVVGDDGRMLDLARPHHDGCVLVAFGSGNSPPGLVPAVARWLDEGKPVVLASRCPAGEVVPVYAFEGGGARLVAMGVIPAGPRTPSQARMELTIALSAGVAYGARAEPARA
ncbi:MAG TPA: asparaginase [Gemmatimonadales bacterium]|jgi:L-asparaginase|nr:asparaginase [Gemmatimonadales bacterium]